MTKGDLAKLVLAPEQLKNIDFAIPIEWARAAHELGIDTTFIVWSYNEQRTFGAPVNLAELYYKHQISSDSIVPKDLSHLYSPYQSHCKYPHSLGSTLHYLYLICGLQVAESCQVGDNKVHYGGQVIAEIVWVDNIPIFKFADKHWQENQVQIYSEN